MSKRFFFFFGKVGAFFFELSQGKGVRFTYPLGMDSEELEELRLVGLIEYYSQQGESFFFHWLHRRLCRRVLQVPNMARMGEEGPPAAAQEQPPAIQPHVFPDWEWIEPDRRARLDLDAVDREQRPDDWRNASGVWGFEETLGSNVNPD